MSACRGCGKEILWGVTDDGKKIPLDPMAPVFQVKRVELGFTAEKIMHFGTEPDFMVSHFATCSRANQFSRSKREKQIARPT